MRTLSTSIGFMVLISNLSPLFAFFLLGVFKYPKLSFQYPQYIFKVWHHFLNQDLVKACFQVDKSDKLYVAKGDGT